MISKLHYITQNVEGYSHSQLAEFACKGGADWIQLRVKNKSYEDWRRDAIETKLVCEKYGARLIINDNVSLAKEILADGVHLGKEDMTPAEARKILGNNFIIGGSTNSIEDIQRNVSEGCDYVGLGPYRFTSTREKLNPVLGLEGINKIMHSLPPRVPEDKVCSGGGQSRNISQEGGVPIIAIGGITIDDVKFLLNAGVYGVAVSSAINFSQNRTESTKNFISEIKHLNLE